MSSLPSITLDVYPRPVPQAHGRLLDNEAVVVRPDRGEIKVLNEIGARIWAMCDGAHSTRDMVVALCAEYDVTPDIAEEDVLAFVAELRAKGLITL